MTFGRQARCENPYMLDCWCPQAETKQGFAPSVLGRVPFASGRFFLSTRRQRKRVWQRTAASGSCQFDPLFGSCTLPQRVVDDMTLRAHACIEGVRALPNMHTRVGGDTRRQQPIFVFSLSPGSTTLLRLSRNNTPAPCPPVGSIATPPQFKRPIVGCCSIGSTLTWRRDVLHLRGMRILFPSR